MSSAATILVADDDRAIRTVLHQALGRQGHTVRSTGTADTAQSFFSVSHTASPSEIGVQSGPRQRKRW